MDIDLIFKIAGIGIIVAILHTVLKEAGKEHQAFFVILVGVVISVMIVIQQINALFTNLKAVFGF